MAEEFPLILLGEQALSELTASFLGFVEKSDEVFLVHQYSAQRVELNFSGVRLICEFVEPDRSYTSFKQIMLSNDLSMACSGVAIGFSEFVTSSKPIMPLVKVLLELASKLAGSLSVSAVLWEPAKIISGPVFFRESIEDFLAGGAFPSLSLIGFESPERGILQTRGLGWFADQEIELSSGELPESEAVRRLVRIIHDIAGNGAISNDIETAGLASGERIFLTVRPDEKLVRVNCVSDMDQ